MTAAPTAGMVTDVPVSWSLTWPTPRPARCCSVFDPTPPVPSTSTCAARRSSCMAAADRSRVANRPKNARLLRYRSSSARFPVVRPPGASISASESRAESASSSSSAVTSPWLAPRRSRSSRAVCGPVDSAESEASACPSGSSSSICLLASHTTSSVSPARCHTLSFSAINGSIRVSFWRPVAPVNNRPETREWYGEIVSAIPLPAAISGLVRRYPTGRLDRLDLLDLDLHVCHPFREH
jgi:hypothetical protein